MNPLGRFGAMRAVATIDLEVRAEGPILVRGPEAFTPDAPDMAFIRTASALGNVPFLPGSSLKGVLRSGTEAMLRTMGEAACLSTSNPCREAAQRCRTCLLFGSIHGAAVLVVEDGMPWPVEAGESERRAALADVEQRRVVRSGVAIDRQTGAASTGKLFDFEALVDASFHPRLLLRNPEPWHLAAIAAALDLLDRGVLRIGSQTTRGLGRVRVNPRGIEVRTLDPELTLLAPALATFTKAGAPPWTVWRSAQPPATLAAWQENLQSWLEDGQ